MIFRNAFLTKKQTDRLRREAIGVGRIPALCGSSARGEEKAREWGALQRLRAVGWRLCRGEDSRALPAAVTEALKAPTWADGCDFCGDGGLPLRPGEKLAQFQGRPFSRFT